MITESLRCRFVGKIQTGLLNNNNKNFFFHINVVIALHKFVCNSRAVTRLSWCNSRNVIVSYLDSVLCRQM